MNVQFNGILFNFVYVIHIIGFNVVFSFGLALLQSSFIYYFGFLMLPYLCVDCHNASCILSGSACW